MRNFIETHYTLILLLVLVILSTGLTSCYLIAIENDKIFNTIQLTVSTAERFIDLASDETASDETASDETASDETASDETASGGSVLKKIRVGEKPATNM